MREMILLIVWVLFFAATSYANNGDLIVDGKLGVGIAAPSVKLDVQNVLNSFATIAAFRQNPNNQGYGVARVDILGVPGMASAGGAIYLTDGIYPSYVKGIRDGSNTKSKLLFGTSDGGGGIVTDHVVIDSTGKVGIGTLSPAYTLDVNGTIRSNNVNPSDARLKENITPLEGAVEKVQIMRGVSFTWKMGDNKNFPNGYHYGVIAQEVEKVLPEVVSTAPDGTKAVAYTEIIPVLIEAIKEQQRVIEKQQQEIYEIRATISTCPKE